MTKKPVAVLLAVVAAVAFAAGSASAQAPYWYRGSALFTDVPAGSWFDESVGWAARRGVDFGEPFGNSWRRCLLEGLGCGVEHPQALLIPRFPDGDSPIGM